MPHVPNYPLSVTALEDRITPVAGDLDPTFGIGGKVITNFETTTNRNDAVWDVVLQPDGRILATGRLHNGDSFDFGLVRYQSNGTVDTTFGDSGFVLMGNNYPTFSVGNDIVLQPNGKILVAGVAYPDGGLGPDFGVVRYNPNGSVDTTFGVNGFAITQVGTLGGYAESMALQSDGKIVVGGNSWNGSDFDMMLTRYLPNGSLDTAFGTNGLFRIDFGSTDVLSEVLIQPNGTILVAGNATINTDYQFAVARLNADGSPDLTFDGDGKLTTDFGPDDEHGSAMALLPDGRILVGGFSNNSTQFFMSRYLPDGTYDVTFDGDGRVSGNFGSTIDNRILSLVVQSNGNIIATGDRIGQSYDLVVARFRPDGSLDSAFGGGDGFVVTQFQSGAGYDSGVSVVLQADGQILVSGGTVNNDLSSMALARYSNVGSSGPVVLGAPGVSVGQDAGGQGQATLYATSFGAVTEIDTVQPFTGFTGAVRTAAADFNGDGFDDLIVATGPGMATLVRVIDGADRSITLFELAPFEASFQGGLFVAVGDLTGDGTPDFAICPDEGGGPRVRVFNGKSFTQIADFFGIDDTNFRGGARPGMSDLSGDGRADLLVAAGFGGGPRLAIYDGARLTSSGGPKFVGDFFVFEQTLRNGVFLSAGDVNGDGFADVVVGGGPGGGPRIFGLSGKDLTSTGNQTQVANFFAGDINLRGGIRVVMKDLDGDQFSDVLVGSGSGAGSQLIGYAGKNVNSNGVPPELFNITAFAGFEGGVFVG